MRRPSTLALVTPLALLALAAVPARAQDRYTVEARAYFGGGPTLQGELVLTPGGGGVEVEQTLRAPGQSGHTLRATGRTAGRYTIVRFPSSSGIEGSLGGIFNSAGTSSSAQDSLAWRTHAHPS